MEIGYRNVLVSELEFKYSVLSATELLRRLGINPERGYDHEQWTDEDGMVIHRYVQPPRSRGSAASSR